MDDKYNRWFLKKQRNSTHQHGFAINIAHKNR